MTRDIIARLEGGDRRSIGQSEELAREVGNNPTLFGDLFSGLLSDNPVVRMRAADCVEKVTRARPELLQPWNRQLLEIVSQIEDKEVRWHLAQMLPRLRLTARQQSAAIEILMSYLDSQSSIVKTCAMQALADFARRDDRLMNEVKPLIERLTTAGTPAMRARGRKILQQFSRCE